MRGQSRAAAGQDGHDVLWIGGIQQILLTISSVRIINLKNHRKAGQNHDSAIFSALFA
jgi:hypothetical protein